jgi:hypothetical protein
MPDDLFLPVFPFVAAFGRKPENAALCRAAATLPALAFSL